MIFKHRLVRPFSFLCAGLISGILTLVSGYFLPVPVVQAAENELFVSVAGHGYNGDFVLSTTNKKTNNQDNAIVVRSDNGDTSVTVSWRAEGSFAPTACFGFTRSFVDTDNGDSRAYAGNVTGSGFFDPSVPLPVVGNSVEVKGTVVLTGTSVRSIGIACRGGGENYSHEFQITYAPSLSAAQECTAGSATATTSGSSAAFQYDGYASDKSTWVHDYWPDGSTLVSGFYYAIHPSVPLTGGVGEIYHSPLACSEVQLPSSILGPGQRTILEIYYNSLGQAWCGGGCENYNPTRTNVQSDGSHAICNISTPNALEHAQPVHASFTTTVSGPTGNSTTVNEGESLVFNFSRQGTGSGQFYTEVQSNSGGPYGHFPYSFGNSYIFEDTDSAAYNDDFSANTAYATATQPGISVRAGNQCRFLFNRETSSVTTPAETFSYYMQRYNRDGGGGLGLWPSVAQGANVLMPFIQVEPATYHISAVDITGSTDGVSVSSGSQVGDQQANTITFTKAGTYLVTARQDAFTAAFTMCDKNISYQPHYYENQPAPYNCANSARRVQLLKGMRFPAMQKTYTVIVNPSTDPDLEFTVNGITADAANSSRTVAVNLAGTGADPLSKTLSAKWSAVNVADNSCAVTRTDPTAGVTISTEPWASKQTGLPITNSSAPITFDGIAKNSDSTTTLTLTCGTGAATVARTMTVNIHRDPDYRGTALTLFVDDQRAGVVPDSIVATNAKPTITGSFADFPEGVPATFNIGWVGDASMQSNSCTVAQATSSNPAVTISGEPWQSGAVGQATTNSGAFVALDGFDAVGTSANLLFSLTCKRGDGVDMTRTVTATVNRVAAATYSISGNVSYSDGRVAAGRKVLTDSGSSATTDAAGNYTISDLADDTSYNVTLQVTGSETCKVLVNCTQPVTINGTDKTDVNFVIDAGTAAGSVLNFGTGSKQWSN